MSASEQTLRALCEAGAQLHTKGWTPATSGNLSARRDGTTMWVTASGVSIGSLVPEDLLLAGLDGVPNQSDRRASAESALHGLLYQRLPHAGAVLHVHGPNATIASMSYQEAVHIEGYELLKAFEGIDTHEASLRVPIVDNHQDMAVLGRWVEGVLEPDGVQHGVLIRGHGLYAWGSTIDDALRHIEAFEFLFTCVLATDRRG